MGAFLKQMPKADGGDAQRTRFQAGTESPATLAEIGITKKQSANAQKLAAIPGDKCETWAAVIRLEPQCRAATKITTARMTTAAITTTAMEFDEDASSRP